MWDCVCCFGRRVLRVLVIFIPTLFSLSVGSGEPQHRATPIPDNILIKSFMPHMFSLTTSQEALALVELRSIHLIAHLGQMNVAHPFFFLHAAGKTD